MEYIVKNEKLFFGFSIFRDGTVKHILCSHQGKPLIDGFTVKLNGEEVEPVLLNGRTEGNLIELTFQIEKANFSLSLELNDDMIKEHIRFNSEEHYDSFEFMWRFAEKKGKVKPIPFMDLWAKPYDRDFETFVVDGWQHRHEGAFVTFESGKQITVVKEPNDDEPIWVRLRKEEQMLIGAAYFEVDKDIARQVQTVELHVSDGEEDAEYERFRGHEQDDEGEEPIQIVAPEYTGNGERDFHSTIYRFSENESVEKAFSFYRDYMAEKGVREPDDYQPYVNYCLYYDAAKLPSADGIVNHGLDEEFLIRMIDVLKALHCTMAYTDQGWDTHFGSLIWDEKRMGNLEQMVKRLEENGISLGVLTAMHMGHQDLPEEALRRDKDGNPCAGDPWHPYGVCACSEIGKQIRYERLKALADSGIKFFSADFHDNFRVRCYGKDHGHALPCPHFTHAKAVNEVQEKLKETCPNLVVEAHDWVDAGGYFYPIYLFNNGHHERWGFEYMWKPFEDYSKGWTENLYYYRLAYRMPMYLHMNLAGLGENAEVLWYYASAIQHLGMGNYNQIGEEKQDLAKRAMEKIHEVREFFYGEEFTGKNAMTHIHKKNGKALVCMFNSAASKCGEQTFTYDELGVEKNARIATVWGNAEIIPESDGFTVRPLLKDSDCLILTVGK